VGTIVINKGDISVKLEGKVALVTGGATGIGRATAEVFAAEGALVYIVDYNAVEGAAAVEVIEKAGGQARFCATDVRSEESVKNALAQVMEGSGRIDVAVLAAGVLKGAFKRIDELSEDEWDATIDTNLKGTFLTAKYAAPLLAEAGESVLLLIASGAGVRGASSSYAYAASKAGMHGMHFKLEQELGPKGVRLHVICPGGIATPLKLANVAEGAVSQGRDPEEAQRNANLGDPMGVARILAFLASEEGSYVRGTIFTR
jgi:NAD(P)-dependent dehydrogenase (short-subunit alcohol dehydrogenase family)